jgi:hypothetical protein
MANIRALRFSIAAGRLSWIMENLIVDGAGVVKRNGHSTLWRLPAATLE